MEILYSSTKSVILQDKKCGITKPEYRKRMNTSADAPVTENTSTTDIYSFWPMKNSPPRKSQSEILEWIKTLPSHIKYILCEVPVGGGKSPLALNLSGWCSQGLGDAFILTPQKVLQKQYEDSFDRHLLHSLYGKQNYTCECKHTNCDIGSDIKPKCDECPHQSAFLKVKTSPNVVFNYTLGLLLFKYVTDDNIIRKRKLIVFDEAHTLENHLTEFNAIVISEFKCKQIGSVAFNQFSNMRSALQWVQDKYVPALTNKIKHLTPSVQEALEDCRDQSRAPSRDEENEISLLKELVNHKNMIDEQLIIPDFGDVYADYVLINEGKTAFKFKELFGKRNFKQIVEPMGDRFLFMSSTILDKDAFCSDLGLDPEKAAFISVDSEFDIDNRPIFYMPTCKMTFGWDSIERERDTSKLAEKIIKLCKEMHPNESGIIHTGSFQIAQWLFKKLGNKVPHMIMHHNPSSGFKRDDVLREFQEDDGIPKLLISPSITEGLDLKDDKSRFAIFAKVPFPFLGDAWVKKRMQLSDNWYKRQALISMIQGGGRIVRSKQDWGHVYILDSSFGYLLSQTKRISPKWWTDSITVI